MTNQNVKREPVGNSSTVSKAERLNTWLPEIAAVLRPGAPAKAQPDGSVRIGNKGSLSVGPGTGLWYDHAVGEGGRDAPSLIRHLGAENPSDWITRFLADHDGVGSLSDAQDEFAESQNEASRLAMDHFVNQSQPIEGTAAEAYLQGRGINAPYPASTRYVADARAGEGAMVAVVDGPEGTAAVQLTYITPDGDKSTVAPPRHLYVGQTDWHAGGGFALTENGVPARTIVVEGVEDALSLQQAKAGTRVMASFGVSNIGKAPVDKTLPVIVFKDGDAEDSQAAKGLAKGVDRLILQGAAVAVTNTPLGEDANSILQSDGPSVLLALVDAAAPADLSIDGHVERCADLSATEYEEARTALAKELGVRVSFLDKQVKARRRETEGEGVPQNALGIEEIVAWPDPVDLADVLNAAAHKLARYIAADPGLIDTAVLWAAHTHILDMINVSPRLAAQAAGPGCGKTVAMEAIGNLVPRPLTASSITAASVFRIIEEIQPTLLLDEADQMPADRSSPLVAVLNSSHRKSSAFVMRTEEVEPGQFHVVRFSTWAAVMFAGIRELPPTLQDRSIVLRLRMAKPGEVKEHLRDGKCPDLAESAQKLARWASDLVALPDIELPPELPNRLGDNWRPLLAIAELAGGDWPARTRGAAIAAAQQQEQGQISMLLEDIHLVFGERDQALSQELVDGLLDLDEKPYHEQNRGRGITTNWLARQLKGVVTHLPALRPLLSLKRIEKLLSSFGTSLKEKVGPVTGRVHARYNVAGAKSGRWSCSGPNLQQIPGERLAPGFRGIFKAPEGRMLIGADYSQMELRAAAEISGDRALRKIYEDGLDLHQLTAAAMAGVDPATVTKEQRDRAKPVNFGSIYGMGAAGLAATAWNGYRVEMTIQEAGAALRAFFSNYPALKRWMHHHADRCQQRRRIVIGAGRVLENAWEPKGIPTASRIFRAVVNFSSPISLSIKCWD